MRGLCPICRKAIERGDGLRWITLEGLERSWPVHSWCFEKDWEFIEAGLEPFPLRLGAGTSNRSHAT
jgi:hypothetical protein